MSFFNTTAKLSHTSRLPTGTTRDQAIAMLSDHEFFLTCGPLRAKHERLTPEDVAKLNPPLCILDEVKPHLRRSPSTPEHPLSGSEQDSEASRLPVCYRVTDVVHAVPKGLWDTNVVSVYEMTDITDGLFVRVRCPLAVVMDTFWQVREVKEGGEGALELVQECTIRCSRLLVGLTKAECEAGLGKIHARMTERLEAELKG